MTQWLPAVGEHVIHRGWRTKGVVESVPEDLNYLSTVKVKWEKKGIQSEWVPSIMPDFDYMVFEWESE